MGKFCEKIVNSFTEVFFTTNRIVKEKNKKKDVYTLSSVFPTPKIMRDIKKIL